MLFSLYFTSLSTINDSHCITHHSFANDLHLQMSAFPANISKLHHSMHLCISDVKAWRIANMLKQNDNTELITNNNLP